MGMTYTGKIPGQRGEEFPMHASFDDDERRTSLGNAPDTPLPGEDEESFRERCDKDLESLSPRETADCAGADLAELYENEEDGGS